MRCAHKYDRALLWHFPATSRMYFSEEELHQYRKCPQKGIVDIFVHDGELLAARIPPFFRHFGCLDDDDAAADEEDSDSITPSSRQPLTMWYVYSGQGTRTR